MMATISSKRFEKYSHSTLYIIWYLSSYSMRQLMWPLVHVPWQMWLQMRKGPLVWCLMVIR